MDITKVKDAEPRKNPHCWYNESSSILRFLVTKVPRPTGQTKVL